MPIALRTITIITGATLLISTLLMVTRRH